MSIGEDLKVSILKNSVFTDITEGILNIDAVRGIETYQSAAQIADVGQLTITSRNKNIDPHVNPDIRFNAEIWVQYQDAILFRGYITDVNVEYGAHGEDTIITINAIDRIGLIQRHKFTEDFSNYIRTHYPDGVGIVELCRELNDFYYYNTGKTEIENFFIYTDWSFIRDVPSTMDAPYAKTAIKAGDNALDVMTQLMQSSLFNLVSANYGGYLWPYPKYDSYLYTFSPPELPITFSSEGGTAIPYKSILVDDGFERTSNLIELSNSSVEFGTGNTFIENSSTYGPYILQSSATDWGSNQLSMSTLFSGAEDTEQTYVNLAKDLLEVDGVPKLNIAKITVDAGKYWNYNIENTGLEYINMQFGTYESSSYRIKHKVNNSLNIEKNYTVIGIKYSIDYNNFYATYTLKESIGNLLIEKQIQQPQIVINGTYDPEGEWYVGDTNFNWSASITGYPTAKIAQVDWDLAVEFHDGSEIINDPTANWNYDAPLVNPLDWQGPGYKSIRATITTTEGWKVYSNIVYLYITAAQTHADFTYSSNGYGGYTFVDTSYDAQSWLWNFGDGTTSTLQNPPIKYWNASGTYSVSLTTNNGVDTDTKTVPITISRTQIPVKYVKYEFKGTRTKTGGVWNKNFVTAFSLIQANFNTNDSISYNAPTSYVANKGTVKLYTSSTPYPTLPTPNSMITDTNYAGTGSTHNTGDIKLEPLVTNGGNTEEYDISFIIDISKKIATTGTNGVVLTTTNNINWDGPSQERFKVYDSWFVPKDWQANIHYEPINVYVSADGTNYYKIGDQNVYRTSIPTGSTVVFALDNKPPIMPPIFPT